MMIKNFVGHHDDHREGVLDSDPGGSVFWG